LYGEPPILHVFKDVMKNVRGHRAVYVMSYAPSKRHENYDDTWDALPKNDV
jgi:hypothetical protein